MGRRVEGKQDTVWWFLEEGPLAVYLPMPLSPGQKAIPPPKRFRNLKQGALEGDSKSLEYRDGTGVETSGRLVHPCRWS